MRKFDERLREDGLGNVRRPRATVPLAAGVGPVACVTRLVDTDGIWR